MKPEEIKTELAKRTRRIRQEKRMPQELIAELSGLSRTSITNIEAGKQSITIENLYRIADALSCSIFDLLPPSQIDTEINQAQTNAFKKRLTEIKELAECILEECN